MSTPLARRRGAMAAALLLASAWANAEAPELKAGVFDPPRPAPEMAALLGSDGRPFTLAQYRGKLVLLAFGFTHCAAVCPVTLATLAQARKALGSEAADLQVVFVTVDPKRDDAAQIKRYLAAFDTGFVGATGSADALARVRQAYGISAKKVPMGDSYAVDHTSSVFLIDRAGLLRAMMPYGRGAKDYVHDARLLLAAK